MVRKWRKPTWRLVTISTRAAAGAAATSSASTASDSALLIARGKLSAQDSGVSDRVAARLRPYAQAVRPLADMDAVQQLPGARADGVDLGVVAAAQPEHLAVGRHAAHVRRAAAGDVPLGDRPACAEGDHRDRALAAVGDEQALGVAARVQAMRAAAGRLHSD